MKKVSVINCSQVYNVAVEKIARYYENLGHEVEICAGVPGGTDRVRRRKPGRRVAGEVDLFSLGADEYFFSAIFTWDLPALVRQVNLIKDRGGYVEIGGPAATAMPEYIQEHTGIEPYTGIDKRFDAVEGNFKVTFTSRGCPHTCPWCLVPRLEGKPHLLPYWVPAPIVADNNILATPREHQMEVILRLLHGRGSIPPPRKVDINSGLDARFFTQDPDWHYRMYSRLPLTMWRTAYDSPGAEKYVEEMVRFLRQKPGITHRQILVYVLVGFENEGYKDTPEEARYRADRVIEMGASPYVMRWCPLDSVQRHVVPEGWTEELLAKFVGYYNVPYVWRSTTFEDFDLAARREKARAAERPEPFF